LAAFGVVIGRQPGAASGFVEAVSVPQQPDWDLTPIKASWTFLR
jgi:hypothetical protein